MELRENLQSRSRPFAVLVRDRGVKMVLWRRAKSAEVMV